MARRQCWQQVFVVALAGLFLTTAAPNGGAQSIEEIRALSNRGAAFVQSGQFVEAIDVYGRALTLAEAKFGANHVNVGHALGSLSGAYGWLGRYADAEPLLLRALAIFEKAEGPNSVEVGKGLNNLGLMYYSMRRYGEADALFVRALAIQEKASGPNSPEIATALANLAGNTVALGRLADAERLQRRALAIREKALGPADRSVGLSVNGLGQISDLLGRPDEAEAFYKRAVSILEKTDGPEHPTVATAVGNLAGVYAKAGRFAEAEKLYKRDLDVSQRSLGADHPDVATTLLNLTGLSKLQKNTEAELDYVRRAAAVHSRRALRGIAGAASLRGGREINEVRGFFGNVVRVANRLVADGRGDRPALARETFETAQWALVSDTASTLTQMAARGATGDERLAALIRQQQDLTADWQLRSAARTAAIALPADKRDRPAEARNAEQLAAIDAKLAAIGARLASEFPDYAALTSPAPTSVADIQQNLRADEALVLVLHAEALDIWNGVPVTDVPEENFVWIVTKTDLRWYPVKLNGTTLGREAAALRCGMDGTAWSGAGAARCADLLVTERDKAPKAGEALPFDAARAHRLYMAVFGEALDLIKGRHLLIVASGPLTQLPFQALVQAPPAGTASEFTHERGRLGVVVSDLSAADRARLKLQGDGGAIFSAVVAGGAAAKAGLRADDVLLAFGNEPVVGFQHAADLIKIHARAKPARLTIWRQGAKQVIDATLDTMAAREWRPVLLDNANARSVRWLARDHAITVLPAVSSLKALRRIGKRTGATLPMIGFGNPLLDGDQADPQWGDDVKKLAIAARARLSCTEAQPGSTRVAAARAMRGAGVRRAILPDGRADLALLRRQLPLPETADELCAVANNLKVEPSAIYLGARATERQVKALSASGTLARYRIVHFATHGIVAGQLDAISEPGLILTPPDTATENDDGYLTVSEIAALKLDADWVILSACNTAAGGAVGAQALSGLARAFFYAQARSLLVSQWEVYSEATVGLITNAVGEMARDATVGRAEALRRAMLTMIDTGQPHEAHPAFWAPFMVVGEGAAALQ